jgi:hypothetical protein
MSSNPIVSEVHVQLIAFCCLLVSGLTYSSTPQVEALHVGELLPGCTGLQPRIVLFIVIDVRTSNPTDYKTVLHTHENMQ